MIIILLYIRAAIHGRESRQGLISAYILGFNCSYKYFGVEYWTLPGSNSPWRPCYVIVGLHLFKNLTFSQGSYLIIQKELRMVNYELRLLVSWKNPQGYSHNSIIRYILTVFKVFRPWFFRSYCTFNRIF